MQSRYDNPAFIEQVSRQMLATPTHEIACRAITDLREQIKNDQIYIDDLLKRIEVLEKDSNELNALKRQVMNIFTGGKLFPKEGDDK